MSDLTRKLKLETLTRWFEAPAAPGHVLVIGGAGYVGSVLCRQLLEAGYRVRVLDALFYGDDALRPLLGRDDFELMIGDSRHIEVLVRAIHGIDAVIHLGEIVGDAACSVNEDVTQEINLMAARLIAEVARGSQVQRLVYASSCSVYGAAEQLLNEESVLNPVSLYGRLKIRAERTLLSMKSGTFHPTIVRFATVYGASPRARFDLVVNRFTAGAAVEGQLTVNGGDQWRPFVHVSDAARALRVCLERPLAQVDGEVFNVGSDSQNFTIRDVAGLVHEAFPEASVIVSDSDRDRRNYRVSFAKIRDRLGFETTRHVEDGIRELKALFAAGMLTDYLDGRYNNVERIAEFNRTRRLRTVTVDGMYAPEGTVFPAKLAA